MTKKERKSFEIKDFRSFFDGGDEEDRTLDLTDANRTLSQLSYAPIYGAVINAANYYTPTGVHLSIGFYRIFANFV